MKQAYHSQPSRLCRLVGRFGFGTLLLMLLLPVVGWGQVTLTGVSYSESFDGIGTSLPPGWSVKTSATTNSLGNDGAYNSAKTNWTSTTGSFANYASADGLVEASTATSQSNSADRTLGVRQTGSFGDPGAAFVLQLANTTGFSKFKAVFKFQNLKINPRQTTFQVDYGFGPTPSFTAIGSSLTQTLWGSQDVVVDFNAALDNNPGPVWIRVVALTASAGSGSIPTYGIDDFSLDYSLVSPPTISNFTPLLGPVGTVVTINGTNFANGATVKFNGTSASNVTFVSSTQLTATVPTGASTGPITVTVGANSGSSTTPFTVIPLAQAGELVISQAYGGGGNLGAPLKNDFIELFNRGATPVSIAGFSVQYATSISWSVTPLTNAVIPAGGYYLVQQAAGSGGNGTDLPTPDASGTTNLAFDKFKVALVNSTMPLSGACPLGPGVLDFVGVGTGAGGADCSEFSPAPTISNTTAAVRRSNGCQDTDNNSADFQALAPNPRNSSAPVAPCVSIPVITYTWTGGIGPIGNSWALATNWSPARLVPSSTDVLLFNGVTTPLPTADLDFSNTQTISQLKLINGVNATFTSTTAAHTLNINGNAPDNDFVVETGSVLNMLPTASAFALTMKVRVGATALISGTIISDCVSGEAANQVLGDVAGNVVFPAGGLFVAGARSSGSPFGSAVAGSVVFQSGALFRQQGGGSPFGGGSPQVTTFASGSTFEYARTSGDPSVSGRTYGNLRFTTANTSLASISGSSPLTIQNNLEVAAPTAVGLNLTGGIAIGGNIVVGSGASLTFDPSSASSVTFNGSTAQTIAGPGVTSFGSNSTWALNNAAGATLLVPVRVNGNLNLQAGLVNTSSTNLLTLAAATAVSGGSNTSYIEGPVGRDLPAGTTRAQEFPVGKAGKYRTVTLTPTALGSQTLVIVEQFEGQRLVPTFSDGIVRVSRFRRFEIAATSVTSGADFVGTVTLSFGPDDQVTNPAAPALVIARTDGSTWNSLGRSTNTGTASNPPSFVAGTLTSASFAGLGNSRTYALASLADPNDNPLPVQLVSFGAQRQGSVVRLHWATATELNAARFEVQRSATGQDFQTIATVAAQGTSTTRHDYAATDAQPLSGQAYYRLRQVDLDGTTAYSAVVAVAVPGTARVYPNPATTMLTVETTAGGGHYRLLSLTGRTVLEGPLPAGLLRLPVSALPAGMYQLELTTPAGRDIHKVVKQ